MTIFLEMRPVSGDLYEVLHDGKSLCRSREPLLAGCRVLLAAGHSPGSVVEVRRPGQVGYSLRSRVGHAAGLTVREDGGPTFVPWQAPPRLRQEPPVRYSGVSATHVAPPPQNSSTAAAGPELAIRVPAYCHEVRCGPSGPVVEVIPDAKYAAMWRVRKSDGSVTDMVNLVRAKELAAVLAMRGPPRRRGLLRWRVRRYVPGEVVHA